MPELSSWNTPTVFPARNRSYAFSSSMGSFGGRERTAVIFAHHAQCLVDHGKRAQAQHVDLQKSDGIDALHVVLRRDFVAVRLVEGHVVDEGRGRDHHAGRVRRRVA
jgi:hypothetical protein